MFNEAPVVVTASPRPPVSQAETHECTLGPFSHPSPGVRSKVNCSDCDPGGSLRTRGFCLFVCFGRNSKFTWRLKNYTDEWKAWEPDALSHIVTLC